jgi:hypothetical protein
MRRAVIVVLSTASCLLLGLGCGGSYEKRLEATLTRMKYQQALDQFTQPATDAFKAQNIYFRAPKPLTPTQQPGLNPAPGQYDLVATFVDLPPALPANAAKDAPPPGAPLRVHVLARVNRKKPPAKKKDEAPAEPAAPRGPFVEDVRNLLASELGSQDVITASLQNNKRRNNDFKQLVFTAPNNDSVRVYFFKQGDYDMALVWDIPPGQEKSPAVVTGADYAMGALAVGPRAAVAFQGGDSEEDLVESGAPGAGAPGSGQAF